jgi:hypothetical protein
VKTINFLINLIKSLIFGVSWRFPEFSIRPRRLLHEDGLVMSTVFVGRQGVGKTILLAMELLEQIKNHPEQPFFIFDWSGGLINTLLMLILSDPKQDEITPRLIYDAMGGREINKEVFVMPMPEFSQKYDPEKPWLERVEDQVDRVKRSIEALNPDLVTRNPTMGGRPVKSLLPNLLLLANAIKDDNGACWQITEATKLLNREIRENARKQFGGRVGKANEYFAWEYTGKEKFDKELAHALADILDVIKSRRIRARVGWPEPGWTPHETMQKGLIVLCDGSGLNNNDQQKDYAFLQLFNLVLEEIKKRVSSAPGYQPVNWVMDEVYTFTETPSVARMLAHLPSEYRNRKLQLFLVIQSFQQLAGGENGRRGLRDMIFSFGNMVVFSLLDIEDCFIGIRNLFPFDPQMVKVPAKNEGQHDIMENRDEQLAVRAYQLQHLAQRECYVRRFVNEARMDNILHVGKTREVHLTATYEDVEKLKDRLMLKRGVLLKTSEEIISKRRIPVGNKQAQPEMV